MRGERGQATVEFAFVLPLLVLALLAVVQVGLVVRDQLGVVHAAREAARAASVDPDPGRAVRAAHRTLPGADVDVGDRPEGRRRDQRHRALHVGHRPPARRGAVPRSRPARDVGHAGGAVTGRERAERERGGVSIVMLAVLVLGLLLATGAARLGGALVGRARAESAADAGRAGRGRPARAGWRRGAARDRRRRAPRRATTPGWCRASAPAPSAAVVVEVDLPAWGALFGPARGGPRPRCDPSAWSTCPTAERRYFAVTVSGNLAVLAGGSAFSNDRPYVRTSVESPAWPSLEGQLLGARGAGLRSARHLVGRHERDVGLPAAVQTYPVLGVAGSATTNSSPTATSIESPSWYTVGAFDRRRVVAPRHRHHGDEQPDADGDEHHQRDPTIARHAPESRGR